MEGKAEELLNFERADRRKITNVESGALGPLVAAEGRSLPGQPRTRGKERTIRIGSTPALCTYAYTVMVIFHY